MLDRSLQRKIHFVAKNFGDHKKILKKKNNSVIQTGILKTHISIFTIKKISKENNNLKN
jgi:hypothetical protein